jgi:hypothetical protein
VRKVSTSTMRDGSFPFGKGTGKPTLVGGHLPLKFQWITHTKRYRESGVDDNEPQTVSSLFASPPEWLPKQLEKYREDPQKHIGPLCTAVAAMVLGDGLRAEEVREEVERKLASQEHAR